MDISNGFNSQPPVEEESTTQTQEVQTPETQTPPPAPAPEPTPAPAPAPTPAPVKTGGVIARSVISKIFAILCFICSIGCLVTISYFVLKYNLKYVLEPIYPSEMNEFLATADLYKSYALKIALVSFINILLTVVSFVLNKINAKKGFGSNFVKVFCIISFVVSGVAIGNCLLNTLLFGRYETVYI